MELRGISLHSAWKRFRPCAKQPLLPRSFGKACDHAWRTLNRLSQHMQRAGAEKLRIHGVRCWAICACSCTQTNIAKRLNFTVYQRGSLRPYTNDTRQIIGEAMRLTDIAFKSGIEFGKCGIILERFIARERKTTGFI